MNESASIAADRLDRINALLGKTTSWLTLLMVVVTFVVVVMRYVFDAGLIWLQEAVIWMHACVFMAGAAWTLQKDEHVRVDVFYRDWTAKRRAIVDSLGVLLFLWPVCGFLAFSAWDYVASSWAINEASREAGGLPYPWLPLMKSFIVLMPLTVALQGVSILLRSSVRIWGGR